MRDRWQENRRASTAKDEINATRWRQLKHTLESKQRVIYTSLFLVKTASLYFELAKSYYKMIMLNNTILIAWTLAVISNCPLRDPQAI